MMIRLNSSSHDSQSNDTQTNNGSENESNNDDLMTLTSEVEASSVLFSLIVQFAKDTTKDNCKDIPIEYKTKVWKKFIQNLNNRMALKHHRMVFVLFSHWCIKNKRNEQEEMDAHDFILDLYQVFNQTVNNRTSKRPRTI